MGIYRLHESGISGSRRDELFGSWRSGQASRWPSASIDKLAFELRQSCLFDGDLRATRSSGYVEIVRGAKLWASVAEAIFQEKFSSGTDRRHFCAGVLWREDGVFKVRTTGDQGVRHSTSMVKANCPIRYSSRAGGASHSRRSGDRAIAQRVGMAGPGRSGCLCRPPPILLLKPAIRN